MQNINAENTAKKVVGRVPMPEQDPKVRAANFEEVPLGYTAEQAIAEANRCLQCKKPPCVRGCPVNINIPAFIKHIQSSDFKSALEKIWDDNSLPAICGRVCPQESQCEGLCVLSRKGEPIAIGNLERYVADLDREQQVCELPKKDAPSGKRVAIVGSGPASLTAAGDLIKRGHEIYIFEALHEPGGVLVYGIPEFRLPKAIVAAEIDSLKCYGANLFTSRVVGRTYTVDDLLEIMGFNAVFLGLGAGLPKFMGIPGENLVGVFSANEYLTRANLLKAYKFPEYDTPMPHGENVVVLGAGNVAMDAARTAKRLGAETVTVVYRRSEEEMPARAAEIHHAKEEGIEFKLLTNPVEYLGDEAGRLKGMKCVRMQLEEPDSSGRRRPVEMPNSGFFLTCDLCIIAAGSNANPLLTSTCSDLKLTKYGYIIADEETGKTTKEGVWAGGDIVTGAATVILAMGAGRKAAASMQEYLALE